MMNPRATGRINSSNPESKKMKKITLRTKIYLTIAGLLALAGILYASNPTPFSGAVPFPNGVAATPDLLLVSSYCDDNIYSLDCNGAATLFATIPGFGSCREKYMTVVPSQSAAAGFTPRDIFVTQGNFLFKIHEGVITLFATIPGCFSSDHNSLRFDHFGGYGFDLIMTCQEGNVFRLHGDGSFVGPQPIATINTGGTQKVETPAIPPFSFGPHGGEIWVADEGNNAVHTVGLPPAYTVTLNVLSHISAEGVFFIPNPPCTFICPSSNWAFFQAEQQQLQLVWAYPLSDFTVPPLGGNMIVTSETGADGADTSLVTFNGVNYVQTSFGPRIPGVNEGSHFVDCDVPTATPTPSPSATFTPTPTATATFTPTPTPTATPTVTPTTCGTAFVIGDLDAVVGNHVTFWGAQWWRRNHLSGGTAPASFKGFANCTNPNPPTCGGTWQSDPGNSSHPPDTVPDDMTVIVSSLITKSGSIESGDIPMMVTIHTDPGYEPNPGHEGTGTVTAVICQSARPQRPPVARPTLSPR
jgi:hypothetical protein